MDVRSAELHHRELAIFVSVHASAGPAVLWPEFEHPVYDPLSGVAFDDLLARALARLTGVPVRTVRGAGAASAVRFGRVVTPTLVHQVAGTAVWTLSVKSSESVDFRFRLRGGEVLYVPASHMWSTDGVSGRSQFLLTFFEGCPADGIDRLWSAVSDPVCPGRGSGAQSVCRFSDFASPDGYSW